jgi:hypothetical protein
MLHWFVRINRLGARYLERRFPGFFVDSRSFGPDFRKIVRDSIEARPPKLILEPGGVDRPQLQKSSNYVYVGLDIDEKESCHEKYDRFLVQSIEQPIPLANVDLIISAALFEHVPDNESAFRNLYACLSERGVMHHYIPSGFHPYSIVLKLVGPKLQRWLIVNLRPGTIEGTGYPAFFDRCTPNALRKLLEDVGFRDIEIIPYYKAADYFAFFLPLYLAIAAFENVTEFLGLSTFSSGMIVTAYKTAQS